MTMNSFQSIISLFTVAKTVDSAPTVNGRRLLGWRYLLIRLTAVAVADVTRFTLAKFSN